MQLHVEDEDRHAAPLLEGGRVRRLDREHVEEPAEHRVHREERRRHAAALAQKLAAAQPEPRRQALGLGENPIFDLTLRGRLRDRREFLVRDEPGRERHGATQPLPHARAHPKAVTIRRCDGRLLEPVLRALLDALAEREPEAVASLRALL